MKEGDIVLINDFVGEYDQKRLVFCERLGKLSLQNKNPSSEGGRFESKVRGNKMLSTFSIQSNYKFKIIGFEKVE